MELPNYPDDLKAKIPQLTGDDKFHAFISHSSKDLEYSEYLLKNLEEAGYTCFHSDRDFTPGKTVVANIVEGINQSRRVLTIISEAMMESSWVEFEVANSRSKANEKKEVTFIPILYNISPGQVPAYVKEINYLESGEPNFWQKLVRTLSDCVPLTATIPAGNIAHGISWSYYYGYLALVLPELEERIKTSEFAKIEGIPILPKMIIVLPETCNCPADMKTVDKNVTHEGHIGFKATRAGKVGRDYKSSVYKVKDPDTGEEYYTVMEYASALMALYEMEQGRIASLDRLEKKRQMKLFKEKMMEIVDHPSNSLCNGKAIFVDFKDQDKDECLSKVIAKRIREELKKIEEAAATVPKEL